MCFHEAYIHHICKYIKSRRNLIPFGQPINGFAPNGELRLILILRVGRSGKTYEASWDGWDGSFELLYYCLHIHIHCFSLAINRNYPSQASHFGVKPHKETASEAWMRIRERNAIFVFFIGVRGRRLRESEGRDCRSRPIGLRTVAEGPPSASSQACPSPCC
jgi:hypothetical protein